MELLNKIKGGLFGVAIGDSLGATTEFLSEADVKSRYGRIEEMLGGGVWRTEPGETTDDTAMTLAVAYGILDNPEDPIIQIGEHFLSWKETKPKDIGIIIGTVFNLYSQKSFQVLYPNDWAAIAELAHYQNLYEKSAGNGSLMRCLPVSLAYSDIDKVLEVSSRQSKMTHYDDLASVACEIYNKIAFRLLNGEELKEAISQEIKGTDYESDYSREPDVSPDGFVVNSFKWVLYHLLSQDTYENVVLQAVNKGGDSDTIAAIAGGLKGIEVGYGSLPQKYKDKLLFKKELDDASIQLYKVRMNDSLKG